jgi:hypothetical protein
MRKKRSHILHLFSDIAFNFQQRFLSVRREQAKFVRIARNELDLALYCQCLPSGIGRFATRRLFSLV